MTVSDSDITLDDKPQLSLSVEAARNLATTTKTVPQMQDISSRWLLRLLPWVQVEGGVYRVNRRLTYEIGDGRVSFTGTNSDIRVVPAELCELPSLRGFDDMDALGALADRFVQQEYGAGDVVLEKGQPADRIILVAYGKLDQLATGKYGEDIVVAVLGDGDFISYRTLVPPQETWPFTVKATTKAIVLNLSRQAYEELISQSDALRRHTERYEATREKPQNRAGEAAIDLASGHHGEPDLPSTFVDYELHPREYHLSVAQTVLRVHSRVADLYNNPMNQTEQQLRLTVEALRERQEHEMVNNREFGLLRNADLKQIFPTHSGPPTPDDLDELISRRRKTQYLFAHPRVIAAFARECTKRGIYPTNIDMEGQRVPAWRGIPIFPCNKIPISRNGTSSIIAMRTGEADQGVVGLHQAGIPDEYQPSLSVRFMGINEKAIISYLVSVYFSVAVLVPDALGVLEEVQIGVAGG